MYQVSQQFERVLWRTTNIDTCLSSGVLREGLLDGDEVLEALGHLEALDVKVTRVQEVVDPLTAVVLRLGLKKKKIYIYKYNSSVFWCK